jgi:hypothetical protein
MTEPNLTGDDRTITVRAPFRPARRGGRKLVLTPDGTNVTMAPVRRHIDNANGQGDRPGVPLARNARDQQIRDHRGDRSYDSFIFSTAVGRVLRLTLLAPDIVERILDRRHPFKVTPAVLAHPFPVSWSAQRAEFVPAPTGSRSPTDLMPRQALTDTSTLP